MRKVNLIFLLLMMIGSLSAMGVERKAWVFQVGGWWESEVTSYDGVSNSGMEKHILEEYSIPGDTLVNGEDCLRFMHSRSGEAPRLLGILKVEGERVYFKENAFSDRWCLLYDFGVSVGDEIQVYSMDGFYYKFDEDRKAHPLDKRLVSAEYDETHDGHLVMRFDERRIRDEKLGISYDYDEEWESGYEWIWGIGGTGEVRGNGDYGVLSGCGGAKLVRAGVGDDVVYSSLYKSSVSTIDEGEEVASPLFDLFGRKVIQPVPGQPYIKGGKVFVESGR